jgi:RHS repeat-associated protein
VLTFPASVPGFRGSNRSDAEFFDDGNAVYTPGLSKTRSGTTTYSHSGLKHMAAQTGQSGSVAASREYDAFGGVASSSGSWQGPFGSAGAFGYQTEASGLMLLGHRYYDPSTGRFLTLDPIGDGSNWYVYGGNDPLSSADPEGLIALQVAMHAMDFLDDIPYYPPRVDVFDNAMSARAMAIVFRDGWKRDERHDWGGFGTIWATNDYYRRRLSWFAMMVTDNGPWDYKRRGKEYENFGNWHYGVVAHEFGIGKDLALRAAGYKQARNGLSQREDGWYGDNPWIDSSYGDDPEDQRWIKRGYAWAERVWGLVR